MAPITGLNGLFSLDGGTAAVPTCRSFAINPTNAAVAGAASNTGGAEFRVRGVSDFTGTASLYTESGLALCVPGTAYQFHGQTSTNALADGGEVRGGVRIDSLTVNCDIENGGIITADVAFSSIGSSTSNPTADNTSLTYQTATALTNSALPDLNSSLGCKAVWGPVGQSLADMPSVRSWSMTLTCGRVPYSASGTGGVRKGLAGRKSATATVNFYEGALASLDDTATDLRQGTYGQLNLYTNATLFWKFQYGLIEASPINVPIEEPGMVENSITFGWSSFVPISGTQTRGNIVDPNGVVYFV